MSFFYVVFSSSFTRNLYSSKQRSTTIVTTNRAKISIKVERLSRVSKAINRLYYFRF